MIKKLLGKQQTAAVNPAEGKLLASQHPEIEYHLDILSPTMITGWICRKHQDGFKACSIEMKINGALIRDFSSNMPRADLAEAGFGEGDHGFEASTNWQKFEVGRNELEFTLDNDLTVIHEFEISQKALMVAMSDHICRHFDESLLQVSRNLLNDLGPKD